MSCDNEISFSFVVIPARKTGEWDQPAFIRAIITIIDAFKEALDMQRAAHRRYPFFNE